MPLLGEAGAMQHQYRPQVPSVHTLHPCGYQPALVPAYQHQYPGQGAGAGAGQHLYPRRGGVTLTPAPGQGAGETSQEET